MNCRSAKSRTFPLRRELLCKDGNRFVSLQIDSAKAGLAMQVYKFIPLRRKSPCKDEINDASLQNPYPTTINRLQIHKSLFMGEKWEFYSNRGVNCQNGRGRQRVLPFSVL